VGGVEVDAGWITDEVTRVEVIRPGDPRFE
jgi:hypothetical protein